MPHIPNAEALLTKQSFDEMDRDENAALMALIDRVLDRPAKVTFPTLLVTKKGNLKCPFCKERLRDGELIAMDADVRWNRATPIPDEAGGSLSTSEGEKNYETVGWFVECCMVFVDLPDGWESSW